MRKKKSYIFKGPDSVSGAFMVLKTVHLIRRLGDYMLCDVL